MGGGSTHAQRLDPSASAASHDVTQTAVLLFTLTIAAQLTALAFGRIDAQTPFLSIVLPSVLFLSLLTLPSVVLGLKLGRQIGLGAPLTESLLRKAPGSLRKFRQDALLAGTLGLGLGLFLTLLRSVTMPYLPAEMPALGFRGVAGGLAVSIGAAVAEEVWFRLGLMTILIWCITRLKGDAQARPAVVWSVIVIVSIAFGLAHLPQLNAYGAASVYAIGGTILGNCAVGILYGWCYWRRSLLAAMIAHLAADVAMHVLPAFTL